MAEVGIRELRDHLSRHLEEVKGGKVVTVTHRGRAVAQLVPVTEPRPFDRLVAEGAIELAPGGPRRRPRKRVAVAEPVSDLVAEQRR